jgi:hypothetical protein
MARHLIGFDEYRTPPTMRAYAGSRIDAAKQRARMRRRLAEQDDTSRRTAVATPPTAPAAVPAPAPAPVRPTMHALIAITPDGRRTIVQRFVNPAAADAALGLRSNGAFSERDVAYVVEPL